MPAFGRIPFIKGIGGNPIALAVIFGAAAFIFRDVSPLFTNVLAFAVMVCLFYPIVQRFRRPSQSDPGDLKMWRGRVIEMRPPSSPPAPSAAPSPMDSIRQWWSSRQR